MKTDINIIQNPNKEFVEKIKQRIKDNDGYCPCRVEKTIDNKCPCLDFRDTGNCICGLYVNQKEEISNV